MKILHSASLSPAAPRGVRADFAPRTQRQSFDAYVTNGRAYQAKRRKPPLRRHAPHLAVPSLTYREFNPRRRNLRTIADRGLSRPQCLRFLDEVRVRGLRREVTETHAFAQLIECRGRRRAFYLRPVHLFYLVLGFRDARLQDAVVGEQQQALAVGIEAAGGIDASYVDVIRQSFAVRRRTEFARDTERFVEGNEHAGVFRPAPARSDLAAPLCVVQRRSRGGEPFCGCLEQAGVARTIRARRDQVRCRACSCTAPS